MKWRKILLCIIAICLALLVVIGKSRGSETVAQEKIVMVMEYPYYNDFESLIADADQIVLGQVRGKYCEDVVIGRAAAELYLNPEDVPPDDMGVHTVYTVLTKDVYKGDAKINQEIEVRTIGGETDRYLHEVTPALKELETGAVYVFFLNEKGHPLNVSNAVRKVEGGVLSGTLADMLAELKE